MFGLGFTLEGISFFIEAIFIGIYIYGWDRMSPRAAHALGHPDHRRRRRGLAHGDLGQRLDEPPGRASASSTAGSSTCIPGRRCSTTATFWHELVHMYLAGYMVVGFGVAAVYAWGWLRGRRGRYERIALGDPADDRRGRVRPCRSSSATGRRATSPGTSRSSSRRFEGLAADDARRADARARLVHRRRGPLRDRDPALLSLLATHDPNATMSGLDACRRTTDRPSTSCASPSRPWSGSERCSAVLGLVLLATWWRRRRLPARAGSTARSSLAGPALGRGADRRLGDDRGRAPALGRLPRDADARTRDRRRRIPVGYATLVLVYVGLVVAVGGSCGGWRASRSSCRSTREVD